MARKAIGKKISRKAPPARAGKQRAKRATSKDRKKSGKTAATNVVSDGGGGNLQLPSGGTSPDTTQSGKDTVSIRMYRGLLGDFFFVRHVKGRQVFKMLIDCGVLQCIGAKTSKPSTFAGKDRIVRAATDFMTESGGQLDLVVATHEHYDHLSGFILANDVLKNLKIDKVWMAWTEDHSDKLANSYRNRKNKALTALARLAASPSLAATSDSRARIETITNLMQFYGGLDAVGREMGVAKSATRDGLAGNASCAAVLDWLKQKAGSGNVSFLKPGDVVHWGVGDAFRGYVLGPPRDDEKLRQLDPSKGAAREVYLARGEEVETVFGLAAMHGTRSGGNGDDQPFVQLHRHAYRRNGKHKRNGAKLPKNHPIRLYEKADEKYRRVDGDWMASAENLALKIDGDVNNTSLAMALELSDRRILLFPGDAQVGNWLSWGDQTYQTRDDKDAPQLKIEELLARTIFYKVGHHASHNATLRARGLELMTDSRLCAMIPVVEATAREQKTKSAPDGWAMPYGDLYKRLNELTSGRVLKGDGQVGDERARFANSIFHLQYEAKAVSGDPLWVELALDF